nr:RLORF1 [synthetic construct]
MTRGHRTALSPSPRATSLCTLMPCTAHTRAHAYCGACRGRGRLLPGQGSALRTATRPGQDSAPGRPARPRTDPGSPERRPAGTTSCAGTGLERPPPRGGPFGLLTEPRARLNGSNGRARGAARVGATPSARPTAQGGAGVAPGAPLPCCSAGGAGPRAASPGRRRG